MKKIISNYKSELLQIKRWINNKIGFDIVRYPSSEQHIRQVILNHHNIELVLDVGANIGQYALGLRALGYKGKIISFEPIKSVFKKLESFAIKDKNWEAMNLALGDYDGTGVIHISENLVSSSMLSTNEEFLESVPSAQSIKDEIIDVKKLDTFFSSNNISGENILLKIDTQGFEMKVLQGAVQTLNKIRIIQLEMPLQKSYDGSSDFFEIHNYLSSKGFELIHLESGYFEQKHARTLEVDGWYLNKP